MKTDPRVDAYIAQAPPFAQPILQEARSRVGKACPSAEETIKWNVPFFLLGDKILASMAAFKKHVKVGVWTGMMPKFVDVSERRGIASEQRLRPTTPDRRQGDRRRDDLQARQGSLSGARQESAREESAREESARQESAREESAREQSAREEDAREEDACEEDACQGIRPKDTEALMRAALPARRSIAQRAARMRAQLRGTVRIQTPDLDD